MDFVLEALIYFTVATMSMLLVARVINYISYLQNSLNLVNQANERVLNNMHEGTLIISKTASQVDDGNKSQQVLFFNNSVRKILRRFFRLEISKNEKDLDAFTMQKKCFIPV